mgnify:CR=1 FL=1
MMRLLTILICVFFLNGCFLKDRIDCGEIVDSVLYDEGRSHLSDYEREVRQRLVDFKEKWELSSWDYLYSQCKNGNGYFYMGETITIPSDLPLTDLERAGKEAFMKYAPNKEQAETD